MSRIATAEPAAYSGIESLSSSTSRSSSRIRRSSIFTRSESVTTGDPSLGSTTARPNAIERKKLNQACG